MAEALLAVGAMAWIIPRFGIMGAAWTLTVLMTVNRGLLTPWLVSREMGFSFPRFIASIYFRPFAAAIPAAVLAAILQSSVLPGRNWLQIAAAMAIILIAYLGVAVVLCVPRSHREMLQSWVTQKLSWARAA